MMFLYVQLGYVGSPAGMFLLKSLSLLNFMEFYGFRTWNFCFDDVFWDKQFSVTEYTVLDFPDIDG